MLKKLTTLLLIFSAIILFNSCGLKARIAKADKEYAIGEYYSASEKYKRIYSRIPRSNKTLRARIAFNNAECQRITSVTNAEMAYANAIRFQYPDSIVYFRYAQALQRNGKYREAANNYAIYLTHDSTNLVAQNALNLTVKLDSIKLQTTDYKIAKAAFLNDRKSQSFSPIFQSMDGNVLFFTSNRVINRKAVMQNSPVTGMLNNRLYSIRKDASGKWEKPERLSEDAKSLDFDDGVCTFSPDGSTMYFTRGFKDDSEDSGAAIMAMSRAGGAWSEPKRLDVFADSTITVAHPALTADGSKIYFVSDAPGGYGGKDIWRATLEGTKCTAIENLGNKINSAGDEMFPYIHSNGKLYFSSTGLVGFGGLDIFVASENKDNTWTVENLGLPINSSGDDFGITFEGNATKGYFSSNRGEKRSYDAIYSFEKPVFDYYIQGTVIDDISEPVADAVVRLVSENGTNIRLQTKKDGTYKLKIDKNLNCVMMASARGFLNQGFKISTLTKDNGKAFIQDFRLPALYRSIRVDNVFYEFGKWDLTPESETGLKEMLKILSDNPNITIELSAHTDYVGNNQANKTLSERRAKSVVDYLIAAGIDAARLSAAGYGEEKPVTVTAEMAQQHSFLKENDVLTEEFILTLSPPQQEIANQINRRTEFKVTKVNFKM
ncbi:MAG: OmpA family protein [Paludibacter sp.]|jgi:peptidoglycan-associated lipoprotein|nr:OmpA family protein [Paludibacter sp.]